MASSTTIYRIVCDMTFEELRGLFQELNFSNTTQRGTVLTTRTIGRIVDAGQESCYGVIQYEQEDGPFLIEGINRFYAISEEANFALIANTHLIIFKKKDIADKIQEKIKD